MKYFLTLLIFFIHCSCRGPVLQQDRRLILSGKHLTEIPDSVFKKTELTYLDLGSSSITFYPPLSRVSDDDSNANHISTLPEKIARLANLETLILNSNNLTTLPASITKLKKLEVLDLSINMDLQIELNKIAQLPSLKILKIVDVMFDRDDLDKVRQALRKDVKIVYTIPEYLESLNE